LSTIAFKKKKHSAPYAVCYTHDSFHKNNYILKEILKTKRRMEGSRVPEDSKGRKEKRKEYVMG